MLVVEARSCCWLEIIMVGLVGGINNTPEQSGDGLELAKVMRGSRPFWTF